MNGHGSFSFPETKIDPINGCLTVRQLYELAGDTMKKYSVPVLWDTKTSTIVNNESSEIIQMFNSAFNDICENPDLNLYPKELLNDMNAVDEW